MGAEEPRGDVLSGDAGAIREGQIVPPYYFGAFGIHKQNLQGYVYRSADFPSVTNFISFLRSRGRDPDHDWEQMKGAVYDNDRVRHANHMAEKYPEEYLTWKALERLDLNQ